ncbi:MAG: MerR family transcriptional regulator [Bifidobacteriaceae bacterium]|jgi:DNA-binding transcriptional MerR regulator|nr:MerR family transcriptional regulator [Bifidobacteriaceae bacterium]
MAEYLLRTGEFARLCGTTKETLRHYHQVGLLHPAVTDANGYQLYLPVQVSDFFFISALRRAGRSLAQIRDYLAAPDPDALRAVLADCVAALEVEKREIARKQRALRGTLARLELLDAAQRGPSITVEWCEAQPFIQTRVTPPKAAEAAEPPGGAPAHPATDEWSLTLIQAVRNHIEYCQSLGQEVEFQTTYRIGREAFVKGDYLEDFSLCSPARGRSKPARLHVKPAGTYLKLLRQLTLDPDELEGSDDLLFAAYAELKDYAATHGYRIAGDAYETELSIYTGALEGMVASQIAVLVGPERGEAGEVDGIG